MTLQDIIALLTEFFSTPNMLVKIGLILLMLLFLLFALVIARQISSMTRLVNQVSFSPVFKMVAYTLVVTSLGLLLVAIFV